MDFLKHLLLYWFVFTAAFFDLANSASLFDFSPAPRTIEGVNCPRNHLLQYRGTQDSQMDPNRALRALFGDRKILIETLFFSTVKFKLMKRPFPLAVELGEYLDHEIQKRVRGGPLTENEALQETLSLVNATFDYLKKTHQVIPTYVDYTSEDFVDWPRDIVFTTAVSPTAATYGNRILVLKENEPKSLDLNFWNKIHNNVWLVHSRDIAEFITFGYIPGSDLLGYQFREGKPKAWHQIRWAFYKSKDPNIILVFTGRRQDQSTSACIDRNESNQLFYHCDYRPGRLAMQPPRLTNELAQLIGVFVRCQSKSCAFPGNSELKSYPFFSQNFKELNDFQFEDQNGSYRYFPTPTNPRTSL